jgi:Na+/phosphate symporter
MMTKGLISLQVTGYMFRLDSIVVTIIAVLGAVSGKQSNKVLAFLP